MGDTDIRSGGDVGGGVDFAGLECGWGGESGAVVGEGRGRMLVGGGEPGRGMQEGGGVEDIRGRWKRKGGGK